MTSLGHVGVAVCAGYGRLRQTLRGRPFFEAGMQRDEADVLSCFELVHCKAGQTLFKEGDKGDFFFIVER